MNLMAAESNAENGVSPGIFQQLSSSIRELLSTDVQYNVYIKRKADKEKQK